MEKYYRARICENGHVTSSIAELQYDLNKPFCEKCGASIISECPNCNFLIKGSSKISGGGYIPPQFCMNCSKPYPWTSAILQSSKDLIAEMDQLNDKEKAELEKSIFDLVSDTPRTPVAVVKFKQLMKKTNSTLVKAMKDLLVSSVKEHLMNQLF